MRQPGNEPLRNFAGRATDLRGQRDVKTDESTHAGGAGPRPNHPRRAGRSARHVRASGKQDVTPRRNPALAGFRPPHHWLQLLSALRANLGADKHPWPTTIGADIGIPYRLVRVVAARTRRRGPIGRRRRRWYGGRRGSGGSNDGPGHQATKHACSHGAPPASSIGSRGCKRGCRNGDRRCTAGDKASLHG
jgi:hypothetical protein